MGILEKRMRNFKFKTVLITGLMIMSGLFAYAQPQKLESVKLSEAKERLKAVYNTNNLEEAYKIVSTIPEAERDSEIWFMLANISQDLNQDEDAVFYLQKAILTDKANDKAYYNLGNLYLSRNQVNSAIKMYKNAIYIKKDFAPYHYNLGCAYMQTEDYKNAKSQFSKAVFLKENEPNYRYNLALTYKLLGNTKKAQKELDIYNKLTQE